MLDRNWRLYPVKSRTPRVLGLRFNGVYLNLFLISLSLLFSFQAICLAAGSKENKIRNPFLKADEEAFLYGQFELGSRLKVLKLQATFLSAEKKMALISGQLVKEGEMVEGRRVVSIERNQVYLKDVSDMVVLGLDNLSGE